MSATAPYTAATGVRFQGGTYRAYWWDREKQQTKARCGFATVEEAQEYRQRMIAAQRPDKRKQNRLPAWEATELRTLSLHEALQQATRTPEGWAWAWGRAEDGRRLVGCLEPDGQISVSVEVWRHAHRRLPMEEAVPDEMRPVDPGLRLVRNARWRPER